MKASTTIELAATVGLLLMIGGCSIAAGGIFADKGTYVDWRAAGYTAGALAMVVYGANILIVAAKRKMRAEEIKKRKKFDETFRSQAGYQPRKDGKGKPPRTGPATTSAPPPPSGRKT